MQKEWQFLDWAFFNLVAPLLTIPIVLILLWGYTTTGFDWRESFKKVISDGQLCFYAFAILAAAMYDMGAYSGKPYILGLTHASWIISCLALLGYGAIVASDHAQRPLERSKTLMISMVVAGMAISLALVSHYVTLFLLESR